MTTVATTAMINIVMFNSSKQEEEDDLSAFVEEGISAFGDLNLDNMSSSQELWFYMLSKIEEEAVVPDFF